MKKLFQAMVLKIVDVSLISIDVSDELCACSLEVERLLNASGTPRSNLNTSLVSVAIPPP